MIAGRFGNNGELYFEIQLVAANGEDFSVEALLDTGFTDGRLAINTQDLEAVGWSLLTAQVEIDEVLHRIERDLDLESARLG